MMNLSGFLYSMCNAWLDPCLIAISPFNMVVACVQDMCKYHIHHCKWDYLQLARSAVLCSMTWVSSWFCAFEQNQFHNYTLASVHIVGFSKVQDFGIDSAAPDLSKTTKVASNACCLLIHSRKRQEKVVLLGITMFWIIGMNTTKSF
jgi:hypothetical protein